MTHDSTDVIGTSAFAAHALWRLSHSALYPSEVFPKLATELEQTYPSTVALIRKGLTGKASLSSNACSVDGALPIVVQIVLKCEKIPLMDGLVENSMLGGDTAARAMLVGMFLSVRSGIPEEVVKQMSAYSVIAAKFGQLE